MGKWKMVRLGDYIEQIRGVSYKPEDAIGSSDEIHKPIIRAHNIQPNGLNLDNLIYVDEKRIKPFQFIQKGDIVVCASSGSKDLVGKAAQAKINMSASFGAFCKVVRSKSTIEPVYLKHYFASSEYRQRISELSAGVNINNLRNEHIDNLEIPLPPLSVQRKIADVLDCASTLIEKRKAQIEKLDLLINSQFIEMFAGEKYPLVKAETLCDFITKGTTPPTNEIVEEYREGLIPYLKVYNLSFDGTLLFDEQPQYVSRDVHENKLTRSKVYPQDVLMNIVGPPLGKFAIVPEKYPECNINQAIAIFRAKEHIIPLYLLYALKQPYVLAPFLEKAVGIRQLNLSLQQCRELEIPLPPLPMQEQFADFVRQADKSKFVLQQSLEKLELNYKSLMQKCFRGDLFE